MLPAGIARKMVLFTRNLLIRYISDMIVTCRAQLTAWTGCSCSVRQALYTAQHFTAPLETHDPRSGRCALENIQYISRHFPMYFITIANYVEKKESML